jgi:hypothetical protein
MAPEAHCTVTGKGPLLCLALALVLTGCSTKPQGRDDSPGQAETANRTSVGGRVAKEGNKPLDEARATALARQLANQNAQALYHCQPFGNGPKARFVGGRWEWVASKGYGLADLEANVSFHPDGSLPVVEVLLLSTGSPEF